MRKFFLMKFIYGLLSGSEMKSNTKEARIPSRMPSLYSQSNGKEGSSLQRLHDIMAQINAKRGLVTAPVRNSYQ